MSREKEILTLEECPDSTKQPGQTFLQGAFGVVEKRIKRACLNNSKISIETLKTSQNISLQKKELKKNGERGAYFRAILNSIKTGVLVADDQGIILINNSLAQILGYKRAAELIGFDASNFLTSEENERWLKILQNHLIIKTSSPSCYFKVRHKEGFFVELEATFTTSIIAERSCLIATLSPVCEEKQIGKLLKESEEEFLLFGESILHQVWTATCDGQLEYANARALEYRGLSIEDALRQVWQESVHPDDLPQCAERWEHSLKTGEPYEVEFRLLRADGKYRWHLGRAIAKRDKNGKIIKWLGTNTDINDQKLAEESLRKSEERFQLAARATNDVMWDWDMVTNQVWWNEGIHLGFGYEVEEVRKVKDKLAWWRERIHPEDKEYVITSIQQFLAGEEQSWKGEYRYICADGSFADVIDRRIVMRDEFGAPLRMVGSVLNITERRQTEKALIESEQRLQQSQKMEALGTLTGGVAHDFNNLLTAIIGNTQLALSRLEPGDPLFVRLTEIEKATNRAANLTRQLLAFSRRQHLERRTVNLNATISEIVKLLQRIIGEDVEISVKCDPVLSAVFADPAQIEQVLMNLCINAREAMPDGGVISIETNNIELDEGYCRRHPSLRPGKYVQIKVSDNGSGIDENVKRRIFEPFFTTKGIGRGTGLGLSIAYGIVKQHDGYINVESEIEKGSIFEIFLPVDGNAIQAERQILQLPLFGGNETILVAEDEEALRNLAKDILSRLGYTILLAKNGEEAVEIYRNNRERIDLLLFDMIMPRMGGTEAFERIKELGGNIPLIFMTGYSSETFQNRFGMQQRANENLGVPVIQKPYNVTSLGHKVREVLDKLQNSQNLKKLRQTN